MDYIFFSKMLRDQPVGELVQSLKRMGADGVDFTVRPGYPVNPDNVATDLAAAAAQIRAAGLSIPMVTTPGDFTDSSLPYAAPLFRACQEADIRLVKLGYWRFGGQGYWEGVDAMRRDVEGFAKLGARHDVKPCLHTHSGNCIGLNASSLMHALKEFDPQQVGAYLDPGHLAVCGEPLSMAFDMTADWLALVAIKDSRKVKRPNGRVETEFLAVGEGVVEWAEMYRCLFRHGYNGPLSFHSEFEAESAECLIEQTAKDIAALRALEQAERQRSSAPAR